MIIRKFSLENDVGSFRIRSEPQLVQSIRGLPTYSEIPLSIREYLEYGSKSNMQAPSFDAPRLTPTPNLPMASSMGNNMFSRMNSGLSPIGNPPSQIGAAQQFGANTNGGGGLGREAPGQRGVCHRSEIRSRHLRRIILAVLDTRCQHPNIDR